MFDIMNKTKVRRKLTGNQQEQMKIEKSKIRAGKESDWTQFVRAPRDKKKRNLNLNMMILVLVYSSSQSFRISSA